MDSFAGLLLILLGLFLWFLPIGIGYQRRVPNLGALVATDLLLGWTGFGWVIALIWSFADTKPAPPPVSAWPYPSDPTGLPGSHAGGPAFRPTTYQAPLPPNN